MITKQEVLRILEQNKGEVVSGSEIALSVGITRSGVGKVINKLREEGYNIDASTRNGYCLGKETDMLSKEGIIPFLSEKNKGIEIYTYDILDSTIQEAKRLAIDGATHGTLIAASEQTAGRGRRGRGFFSPARTGVYMSILLKPTMPIENAILITTAASVAVCRAISKFDDTLDMKIKWVNDVYISGKKICGILTEAVTGFENGVIDSIILGIGINVNTTKEQFPEEIRDIVTSLSEENVSCDKNRLIAEVLNETLACFEQLEGREFLEEYRELSFVIGKQINVVTPTEQYEATAIDIDKNGGLIVKDSNGRFNTLNSGEITIRRITE